MIICTFFYPWCLDAVSNCILHSLSHTIDISTHDNVWFPWPIGFWYLSCIQKNLCSILGRDHFFPTLFPLLSFVTTKCINVSLFPSIISLFQWFLTIYFEVANNYSHYGNSRGTKQSWITAHRYEEEKSSCGLLEGLWSLNQRTWLGSIPRQELSHIVSLIVIFTTTTTNWNKY